MAKFFAQQVDCRPYGISGNGRILQKETVEDIKNAVTKHPTHVNSWLIFRETDEGNQFFPIMYVNIKEDKWIDL
ncbi:hypothetical protein [Legionella maioricensis]|uniref:Uncharacterized protein n=1 Tax=Legionella maioricensis TaxID=2896528 RepID=A0A9X2CZF0_9GAMM|nr:hypothetical protein [Legionella maioricensis]MCL9683522.1 hypothetical protein [Legionella maioricensis]MCL9686821.1 hypothetical protein [Legionella maioricensis]